ncbi:Transglycosylase SLT domain 1 [uncultured Caudovirales phage]|uniref:Transglycosylase SLT domain 1 n=1 Tax=uncultured Caudovirales phage TaxID=2100421 RepID=A0A6J5MS62_9CAUD|nr:Transglycosylase SLT domain 1 [uncultured Caudovirales phage]CAB4191036.1 Transglycosylase SLT domain 1 [uncultured Caudovirales phage]CAB4222980.1 Transglycosylase SLT domain 1 [uncultured Caudovirales phage]
MNVKRFLGLGLFTWMMCWIIATGWSSDPVQSSPTVQTSPRITVQIMQPLEVEGQFVQTYPATTSTTVAPIVFAEELRDLPCAQWFATAVDAGWPNDPKVLKTLSKIMMRESACDPSACSTSDSGRQCRDYGLIQANWYAHHIWWEQMGLTPTDMFDPYTNLHWAWLLYSGREAKGQCGWQPWSLC